jgi:class 3 adenylate cyclase
VALDAAQRALRALAPVPAPDNVLIVGIDAETERRYPQPFALWQRPLASALIAIAQANPRVIALDVVLPERAFEDLVPGAHAELLRALVQAKHRAGLAVGVRLDRQGRPQPFDPLLMAALGPDAFGLAYAPVDVDGVARRTRTPSPGSQAVPLLTERVAALIGRTLPSGIVDFACGAALSYLPMHELIDRAARGDPALRTAIANKVVLVGHVGTDEDPLPQPLSLAAWDAQSRSPPGVVFLAHTTRALEAQRILPQLNIALLALLTAACACIVLVRRPRWIWTAALAGALSMPVLVLGAYRAGWFVPPITPLFALMGGAALRAGREGVLHWRYRRTIERQFAGYVSQNLFDALLTGEVDPSVPRRYRNVGFLFADLRGFTTMVEKLPPEQVLSLLNRYYEAVTPAIHRFDGTIDNFRGDGILALFGAPRPAADGAGDAVRAARAMLQGLDELIVELAGEGQPALRMGIGLCAGDAVAGNIGTRTRYGYSAVGDAVNVAARLQSHCRRLGMKVIASDAIATAYAAELPFQPLGPLELQGHAPVLAFGVPQEGESVTSSLSDIPVGEGTRPA